MPKQLEMVYLMKVVMGLFTKGDLFNFLQISHKCLSTLQALKVNPIVTNEPSLLWFTKHFTPDTMDLGFLDYNNVDLFYICNQVRNVNFCQLFKTGLMDEDFARNVFPKVTRMVLFKLNEWDEDMELYKNTAQFIIKNAKYFTSLYYLQTDLDYLIEFLEIYTENGKEMYQRLPQLIHVNSENSFNIQLDNNMITKLEKLESLIPDNQRSDIYIEVSRHPTDEKVLNTFRKMKYVYFVCTDAMCEKWKNNFKCDGGEVFVEGSSMGANVNEVIERAYATKVSFLYSNKKQEERWMIPKCVNTLVVSTAGFVNEDLERSLKLDIDFSCICSLRICNCNNVEFDNEFKVMEEMSIEDSCIITFNEECHMKKLLMFYMWNSNNIKFLNKNVALQKVSIFSSSQIEFSEEIEELQTLVVVKSQNIKFLEINLNGKVATFNQSEGITFNGIDCDEYFQKYSDIQNEENTPNIVEFPIQMKEENEWKMHKFISTSQRVVIQGNEIVRRKEVSDEEYDVLLSLDFFNKSTSDNKMRYIDLQQPNTINSIEKVAYFEIAVTGFSWCSVGLLDTNECEEYRDSQIGWLEGSIGFHSDDGTIYIGTGTGDFETNIQYGEKAGETNIIGVGVEKITENNRNTVFFTCNGNIVFQTHFDANHIDAAIGLNIFNKITINYGETPFKFDLNKLKKEKSGWKCLLM
ncbi:hypothetical protein EIN_508770 [Entamoeba invadens IP1]|uniref:SPRY domain-containing protein n=1 Tax=Entamoeba invadens IP1 TaxID=370355 RepID=A0A0A1UFQ9_ENTIV|nr:hypothetical protein EIN_508770 [Entamoeba invadens IP1]ELP92876.1 hypothetical protein EIN_508770 [Entamoeba invadens IP1]|eukprot:XP_004259647.1 hypothetical protein EIN_508770 [Entamoeba invadens IP1]